MSMDSRAERSPGATQRDTDVLITAVNIALLSVGKR
jgi:hypothetical protein